MSSLKGLAGVLMFVAGCVTTVPIATPSGKPEVTVKGAKKAVVDAVVAEMMAREYTPGDVNDYMAIFPASSAENKKYLGFVTTRWKITFTESDGQVHVTANLEQKSEDTWKDMGRLTDRTVGLDVVTAALNAAKAKVETAK